MTKSERAAAKAKAFREGPEGWRTFTHWAMKGGVGGNGGWHKQRFAKKKEKVSPVYLDPTNIVKCSREVDGLIMPVFLRVREGIDGEEGRKNALVDWRLKKKENERIRSVDDAKSCKKR